MPRILAAGRLEADVEAFHGIAAAPQVPDLGHITQLPVLIKVI